MFSGKREGVGAIKYLFWNLQGKNLVSPLAELVLENDTDILTLAEAKSLDCQKLVDTLRTAGQGWRLIEVYPKGGMKVFARQEIKIKPHVEEQHYSAYKVYMDGMVQLLMVLHLPSPMFLEESARDRRAENISRVLRKIEEGIFGGKLLKSIVVGDFNLQPYSYGVAGIDGFNATMSVAKALQKTRTVDGEKKYFYFNPMWKLMGENKPVQGTYYNNSDSQEKSIYWYTFDEVLIRPGLIEGFNWDYFEIVEKTMSHKFLLNAMIDKERYSDHLPIKFEISEVQ